MPPRYAIRKTGRKVTRGSGGEGSRVRIEKGLHGGMDRLSKQRRRFVQQLVVRRGEGRRDLDLAADVHFGEGDVEISLAEMRGEVVGEGGEGELVREVDGAG
jgi:hypothetical protein